MTTDKPYTPHQFGTLQIYFYVYVMFVLCHYGPPSTED